MRSVPLGILTKTFGEYHRCKLSNGSTLGLGVLGMYGLYCMTHMQVCSEFWRIASVGSDPGQSATREPCRPIWAVSSPLRPLSGPAKLVGRKPRRLFDDQALPKNPYAAVRPPYYLYGVFLFIIKYLQYIFSKYSTLACKN